MERKSEVQVLVRKLQVSNFCSVALQHLLMYHDLVGFEDLHYALLLIFIDFRCQQRILGSLERIESLFYLRKNLPVVALHNLISEHVNMSLQERYGLCKNVETSPQQVNEDYFMIAHDAENSFVIIAADYRRKVDFDANK